MLFDECTDSVTQLGSSLMPMTQAVLTEIMDISKMRNWKELFVALDNGSPGIISSHTRMRQLAKGHRHLKPSILAQLAKFAINAGWAGSICELAASYEPPTEEEIKARRNARRYERRILQGILEDRIISGEEVKKAQRQAISAIPPALERLSASGFNSAEILYMVAGWLSQNSGYMERGKRQKNIVHYRKVGVGGDFLMEQLVDLGNIPRNFQMQGHDESLPHIVEFAVRPFGISTE